MPDYDTRWMDGMESDGPEDDGPTTHMDCDICGETNQKILRETIAEAHRDPTTVYHLECGHAVL
jgi:hypothetical protein